MEAVNGNGESKKEVQVEKAEAKTDAKAPQEDVCSLAASECAELKAVTDQVGMGNAQLAAAAGILLEMVELAAAHRANKQKFQERCAALAKAHGFVDQSKYTQFRFDDVKKSLYLVRG